VSSFQKKKEMKNNLIYKVVLVGNSGVGKTSIVQRFSKDEFSNETTPTIGSACTKKIIETSDGDVMINVWDTAGQERFQSLIPMYIKGSDACIIVVDLSMPISFEELSLYFDYLYDQLDPECFICICGNKSDLVSPEEDLSEIKKFAQQRNCPMYKVSAKTGIGVFDLFLEVALQIKDRMTNRIDHGKEIKKSEGKENCC
jgi:small GTP-binding protein